MLTNEQLDANYGLNVGRWSLFSKSVLSGRMLTMASVGGDGHFLQTCFWVTWPTVSMSYGPQLACTITAAEAAAEVAHS